MPGSRVHGPRAVLVSGAPGTGKSTLAAALVLVVALLAAIQATVGLNVVGWAVGLVVATVAAVLLAVALHRGVTTRFGPANVVTLVRASLGQVVAALVAALVTAGAVVALPQAASAAEPFSKTMLYGATSGPSGSEGVVAIDSRGRESDDARAGETEDLLEHPTSPVGTHRELLLLEGHSAHGA